MDAPASLYNNILDQADTIEKLCDEFVVVPIPHKSDFYALIYRHFKDVNYESEYEIVYGAIWTDKGLIYVAKMNEKGKLELL